MKVAKMSIAILAIGMALTSCQKGEDTLKDNVGTANIQKDSPTMLKVKTWYHQPAVPNGPSETWYCSGMATNCMSTVTIRPKDLVVFDDIFNALDDNDYAEVLNIIWANGTEVKNVMGNDLHDAVVNGTLKLSYKGESPDGTGEDLYLLFTDNVGNIDAVIPINK
ncbi:MAG: hypothetical protein IBJ09_11765 [Bacteroidia bacterium]|nr:hypothetical protein [Bacteroidia bacterium]